MDATSMLDHMKQHCFSNLFQNNIILIINFENSNIKIKPLSCKWVYGENYKYPHIMCLEDVWLKKLGFVGFRDEHN